MNPRMHQAAMTAFAAHPAQFHAIAGRTRDMLTLQSISLDMAYLVPTWRANPSLHITFTTTVLCTALHSTVTAETIMTMHRQRFPCIVWQLAIVHLWTPYRLVGLVVKASVSRAEDPGFESRLRRDFFGVESYQ